MSAQNTSADWPATTDEQGHGRSQSRIGGRVWVFYDRYHERAYQIARAVCRDNGRAEDAVQEAFSSIWTTRMTTSRRSARSRHGC